MQFTLRPIFSPIFVGVQSITRSSPQNCVPHSCTNGHKAILPSLLVQDGLRSYPKLEMVLLVLDDINVAFALLQKKNILLFFQNAYFVYIQDTLIAYEEPIKMESRKL